MTATSLYHIEARPVLQAKLAVSVPESASLATPAICSVQLPAYLLAVLVNDFMASLSSWDVTMWNLYLRWT